VAARTLQGAFGAILAPSALGTLVSTFQDPRERGRAFGVFGSVAAGGGALEAPAIHAIPVALPCCSPVINPASLPPGRPAG
jgi:MFS family permease